MLIFVALCVLVAQTTSTDITYQVFGTDTDILPAAFGDFNSDELTDLFVTRNDGKTIEILLGSNEAEPLLKAADLKCNFKECSITNVVPGDFNGDAFMDVLVTTKCPYKENTHIHVLWGRLNSLNCSFIEREPILETQGEPLALDYNNDFIIDLFGVDKKGERAFWIFSKDKEPECVPMNVNITANLTFNQIRQPHSNAYLDLNNDNIADLFITSVKGSSFHFEVWHGSVKGSPFPEATIIKSPRPIKNVGQSLFLDLELKGKLDHVLPVINGSDSKIFVYSNKSWHDLKVDFQDLQGTTWRFYNDPKSTFLNTITLRGGDYNMDGYPDLLATLTSGTETKAFLLENSPCSGLCDNFTRNFHVKWDGFAPVVNDTVQGVFYDIFQDGIIDVILVKKYSNGSHRVAAFKNNLDYDANFVKVMVLTGLTNEDVPVMSGPLGKRKRTFGTNLPGPRISYKTLDQEGNIRAGVSAQIPQSAHYSLNLPYTMFALGRTPNFVDNITVGFASMHRDWPQVIPNSQMVIIPSPKDEPGKWKVQLFVTPSKVIVMSGVALAGTCLFISIIIAILHWKEKRADQLERLQEAYRFNFDAM